MPISTRLFHLAAALALACAGVSCTKTELTVSEAEKTTREGPRTLAARDAEAQYGVPADLLLSLGWVGARLQEGEGKGERHGPMGLPSGWVKRASTLAGLDEAQAQGGLNENFLASAALLADFGGDSEDPAAQRTAIERFSAFGDGKLARAFATRVLQFTRDGATLRVGEEEVVIRSRARRGAETYGTRQQSAVSGDVDTYQLAHPSNYTWGRTSPIQCIVIHVVQGSYWGAISWFQNPSASVSAHYVISADGDIAQTLGEQHSGWHAGSWWYNSACIGIEHEGWVQDPGSFTGPMYTASAALVRQIAARHGIPLDREHIFGHVEVPGASHTDPGPYWNWDHYMALLQQGGGGTQALDASFVGQGASSPTIAAGQPFNFWFTVRNDGAVTWTDWEVLEAGQALRLGFTGGEAFGLPERISLNAASKTSVAPGEEVTFHLTGTAPPTPGTYRTHWRLVSEAIAWFGPELWLEFEVTEKAGLSAQFIDQSLSATKVRPGAAVTLTFTVENTGSNSWVDWELPFEEGRAVRLGFAGGDALGLPERLSLNGASDVDVHPGEQTTFTLEGTAPSTPGIHRTHWQLVSEGVAWFGPVMWLDLEVEPAPGLDAQFIGQGASTFFPKAGEPFEITFTLQNSGSNSWVDWGLHEEGRAVRLGFAGGSAFGIPARVSLNDASLVDVHPGKETTFTLHAIAPSTPGVYRTQWRLVSEAVAWFGPEVWLDFHVQ